MGKMTMLDYATLGWGPRACQAHWESVSQGLAPEYHAGLLQGLPFFPPVPCIYFSKNSHLQWLLREVVNLSRRRKDFVGKLTLIKPWVIYLLNI